MSSRPFQYFALADIAERLSMEDCHTAEPQLGLFAVADGIGGLPGGGEASQTAVSSLARRFGQLDPGKRLEPDTLRQTVFEVNEDILARGVEAPSVAGMGTTLAAVVLDDTESRILNVGDSRIYHFRSGRLRRLTRDHTVTEELVELKRLTPEDAKTHPLRGFLSRFLGSPKDWEPDIDAFTLTAGDWLLLLTDGVTAVLSDERIEKVLSEERKTGAESVCRRLIREALERKPPDNVTAIAVGIG